MPTVASDQTRKRSQSASGAPSNSAIIRVGSGAAICSANSVPAEGSILSSAVRAKARSFGSRMATCLRVNPELISLRSCRCRGGSVKIRLPSSTGFSSVGSGTVMPLADENSAGLVDTKRTSSYLSNPQNPAASFQHTGSLARSSRYAG